MVETWTGDVDCVVFLQTIEHVQDPGAVLERLRELVGPGGVAYVSTPNVLTLAPAGAERSGNPWHVREYQPDEYRALCERHFAHVDLLGLFHARRLRAHQLAIEHAGWDAIHARLRDHQAVLRPLHAGDLRARLRACAATGSSARSTCSPSCGHDAARRAGARPAHPHALRRGLRDVAVRRGVAVGGDRHVLPAAARRARRGARPRHAVGDAGARRPARGAGRARPLRAFLREIRPASHALDLGRRPTPGERAALEHSAAAYAAAADARRPAASGARWRAHATWTSAATHADPAAAGHRRAACGSSSRPASRRTGRGPARGAAGFWLPECAHAPWLDPLLEEAGRARGLRRPHRRARRAAAAAALRRRARCSSRSTARCSSSCGARTATRRAAPTATRTG